MTEDERTARSIAGPCALGREVPCGFCIPCVMQSKVSAALSAARASHGLRPEVLAFAQAMESALRRHDAERGDSWKTCDMDWLFGRLQNESNELRHEVVCCAIHSVKPYDSVQREAADVANFAMMIWNVAAARRGQ